MTLFRLTVHGTVYLYFPQKDKEEGAYVHHFEIHGVAWNGEIGTGAGKVLRVPAHAPPILRQIPARPVYEGSADAHFRETGQIFIPLKVEAQHAATDGLAPFVLACSLSFE